MSKYYSNKYYREYQEAKKALTSVENHIRERLYFLTTRYPDVCVTRKDSVEIKAHTIASRQYINELDIEDALSFIDVIEEYLQSQEQFKQGKLF